MRARPRRGALGLRGRIVGAVLVTTVATLGVAAVALLGPLEHELRNTAKNTLRADLRKADIPARFKRIDLGSVFYYYISPQAFPALYQRGLAARDALLQQQRALAAQLGATETTLLGYPDQLTGRAQPIIAPAESDLTEGDNYNDVVTAFMSHRAVYSFGSINGKDYVRAAIPIATSAGRFVLAVRKPIDEIPGAVHAVARAFVAAAIAGIVLTLLLGIPLSGRLARRLRRLRQAALRLAEEGPGVDVPVDRAHDEVGDLARTFALMQRQLQHQEEARRAFVATASHELRTPLASLDGMLELLDEDLRSGDPDLQDARSLLDRARVQSRRLARLAADLLDLSRIDAEVQLRSEPVELGELSRAVLAEFELGTAEREVNSSLDSAGPVWALGDPGSVARIVRILLDNAVRVSPPGSSICVSLGQESEASLSVCDEGPGVPAEERELIFERFQRGRETGREAGFGLGLAIGRELAERMGGELVLDHSWTHGAKFILRLPVARAPEEDPLAVGLEH